MYNSITAAVETATDVCSKELGNFIAYIQTVDPDLKGHEAIAIAATILNQLPRAFKENPKMLADLKAECEAVKELLRK